jgi:hypothetical protein
MAQNASAMSEPIRTKLINGFVSKREEILAQSKMPPGARQQQLADIDKMLQILADQVEPS